MLTDAQVDRYSRQILLPEVGGRGQARLLAARVAMAGGTEATATAATLLARAGVGELALVDGARAPFGASPDCRVRRVATLPDGVDVLVDLGDGAPRTVVPAVVGRSGSTPAVVGRGSTTHAVVALLVGRPCVACAPASLLAVDAADGPAWLAGPAALALGALAAGEALRALLVSPSAGRRQLLDLGDGRVEATALAANAGCAACGGAA